MEEGTTARQRVVRGPLGGIARIAEEAGVASPAVIVVGEVARFGLLGPQLGEPTVEAAAMVGASA